MQLEKKSFKKVTIYCMNGIYILHAIYALITNFIVVAISLLDFSFS